MTHVQIGNVAEYDFEYEFAAGTSAEEAAVFQELCDAYAAVAAFFSTDPDLVVLPRDVEDGRWWEAIRESLDWRGLRRRVIASGDRPLSTAIAADPAALSAVTDADTVLAWGETSPLRVLAGPDPEKFNLSLDPEIVRTADSKANSVQIFAEVKARLGAAVEVPATYVCGKYSEAIRVLQRLGSRGQSAVVKTCHGSGGWGTTVLAPELLASGAGCSRTFAGLRGAEPSYGEWPIVIQECVPAAVARRSDLTADGVIGADGAVRVAGMATMLMSGSRYAGCVVAPERCASSEPWSLMAEFTVGVGHALRERGYRGWYDVDFILSATGAIFALEINTRRSGPSVAYTIGARLREIGSEHECVAASEVIRLPRRVGEREAFEAFHATRAALPHVTLIPTTFLATDSARPSIGFAVGAATEQEAYRGLCRATDVFVAMVAGPHHAHMEPVGL